MAVGAPVNEHVPAQHPPSDAAEPGARPRLGTDWRWLAGIALAIYVASRVVQLAIVSWLVPPGGSGTVSRLMAWDAGWFVRVAREGYPHGYSYDASGTLVGNGLAFFPVYPAMVRLVHLVGVDWEAAALTVSWLAGGAAAVLVCALGAHLYEPRVGLGLTALFCTQPMSVVLSMGYSEGLFVALVAGTLLAAYRRAWLTAGGLGAVAGLTRPTGAALALALALAAAVQLGDGRAGPVRWRAVVGALVALAAVPAYLVWVGLRVGAPGAWFDIQTAGWGSTFDFGAVTGDFVVTALRQGDGWIQVSVAWFLIAAVVSALVAAFQRTWPPLVAYGLIALILVVGQGGYYHSKPRLLVPVLLVLVPVAVALGRVRPSTAVLALVGWAAFGLWYGAYLITVWHYAI
jgi:Mannosyltransferase (PIG-V)